MKKNHLLIIVFVICISGFYSNSFAQYTQWNYGLELGPSATFTVGNDAVDLDTKPDLGFLAGIFGQYNFNRTYALKMAAYYQMKGSKIAISNQDPAGNSYQIDGKIKLSYITIPLLFRATFGDYVKFFVNAGPYLGILLKNETTIDANTTYNIPETTIDNTDSTKSTDFGITTGLGLQVPMSKTVGLTFELRDDIGLTDISDYTVSTSSTKNNSVSLLVGLTFNAGKRFGVKK